MTLSISSKGLFSANGSSSKTSSPAAPTFPDCSAAISACVSTNAPRAVLTKETPSFMAAKAAAPIT